MYSLAEKGRYQVTAQSINEELYRRDFDAEQWWYSWVSQAGHQILRLEEVMGDNESIGYVEFSCPVNIEFVPEE